MEYLERFSSYLLIEKGSSKHTAMGYIKDLQQFFNFVKKEPINITHTDILNYLTYLKTLNLTTSTSNRKLSSIKSFYKFCVSRLDFKNNPSSVIEQAKCEKRLPKPIEHSHINKMINLADNLRDKTMLETLYGTGVRREELVNIKVSNINFERNFIKVLGKGGKERIIPIYPKLSEMMRELTKSTKSEWLFTNSRCSNKHISVRGCNYIIEVYKNRAGLQGFDITPHKFRHSFASALYENGADIKAIKEMMGHSSIDTTNNYAKVCVGRNTDEYLKCHPMAK